jgi:hypothetical protein
MPTSVGRRLLAVLGTAVALTLMAACGNDTVDSGDDSSSDGQTRTTEGALDTAPVKPELVNRQKQISPDLAVGEARCPARVELNEGVTLGCSVQVEGLPAPWTVTVTDVNKGAKTAEYEYELTKAVLSTARLNAAASRSEGGLPADCGGGSKARLQEVGTTIVCTITDLNGLARSILMRVDDVQGNVSPAGPLE